MTVQYSEFRIKQTMDELHSIMKSLAFKKDIILSFKVPEDYVFFADEGRIKQVMYNLLSNAVKFTPKGGKVDVEVWADEDKYFVSVTDTGIGIKEDSLKAIFEEFRQLEETETKHTRVLVWA